MPSLTFSFIPCLEGYFVGGNKTLLSCCIQAAASSLFALFFAGKSLNSPPKAGLFPRATPWTRIQSCGQRAVSSHAGALGLSPTQAFLAVASSEQKPFWPDINPPMASEGILWASELAGGLNNFIHFLLM